MLDLFSAALILAASLLIFFWYRRSVFTRTFERIPTVPKYRIVGSLLSMSKKRNI